MATAQMGESVSKRIGRALAAHRLQLNLTQEQVAAKLCVEQETISRFERGATLPPLLRLIDFADLYGVPLDALVRVGSSRPIDQASDIVTSLASLSDADREWVRNLVKDLCNRLANA